MQSIGLSQVKQLLDQDAQLVEVLPPAEFVEEHLPGAINIPLKAINAHSATQLDPVLPVVVYCYDSL